MGIARSTFYDAPPVKAGDREHELPRRRRHRPNVAAAMALDGPNQLWVAGITT